MAGWSFSSLSSVSSFASGCGAAGSCVIASPADTPKSKLKSLSWLDAQVKLQPMRSR
jgi:hypothetical protein